MKVIRSVNRITKFPTILFIVFTSLYQLNYLTMPIWQKQFIGVMCIAYLTTTFFIIGEKNVEEILNEEV